MKRFGFVFALFLGCVALLCSALATDILTNRGDKARTGLNANETALTPSIVSSPSFGLLYNNPVDGQVYAQPLYVSNQLIIVNGRSQGKQNVLYVATEHDSLYAFDADSGVQYWSTSLLLSGESPVSSNDVGCSVLPPEIGITATPVIDRSAGPNGTIFVVAMSKNATNFFYRLHAIDLSTGQDRLTPVIISGSVTGTGPATTFVAKRQINRAGLLLLNNVIYTAWGSFCDTPTYAGWIIGYNENDFSSTVALFNTDPNGPTNDPTDPLRGSGNGIWQSGNGPAIDANNNIYVSTGNGPFDSLNQSGFPANRDFGDSVLKLTAIGGLSVSDFFTPSNQLSDRNGDIDLGSGGPMVLDIVDTSGITHHLLTQAGKDSNLYLLDRNNLGKFHSSNQIYQELDGVFPGGVWSSPAYFNGSIYLGGGPEGGSEPLLQLQFDFTNPNKPLLKSSPVSSTMTQFGFPGATPTISSNGTTNGIVWAYEFGQNSRAILHAYDATNLRNELYNSNQVQIGGAVKFAVPTVCNGKVFVGTANSVAVFGPAVAKDFNGGMGKHNHRSARHLAAQKRGLLRQLLLTHGPCSVAYRWCW
jgi:outer membrane protein assembly factor BamB